jgi:lipopolysaccharide export system protein LptA
MSTERWWQPKRPNRLTDGRLIGAALAWFCWTAAAMGASSPGSDADPAPRQPVRIQSEQLVAEMEADRAEFSGAVRVEGEGYTITADRLTIQFQPGSIGGNRLTGAVSSRQVSRITARGRVRILTDTLTADAEQAVYEPPSGQIWLGLSPSADAPQVGGRTEAPRRSVAQTPSRPSDARIRVTLRPGAGG